MCVLVHRNMNTFAPNKCIEAKFSYSTRMLYNLSSVPEGWQPDGWRETRDGRVVPDDHDSEEGESWKIFRDDLPMGNEEKEFPIYPSSENLKLLKEAFKLFPVPERFDDSSDDEDYASKDVSSFPLATCKGCGRVSTFQGQCPGNKPLCGDLIWPGESQNESGVEDAIPIQPAQEHDFEDDDEEEEGDPPLKKWWTSADESPLVPRALMFARRCDAAALADAVKAVADAEAAAEDEDEDEDAVLVEAFEKHLGAEKAYNTYLRSRKHEDFLGFDAFSIGNRIDAVKGVLAYGANRADDKVEHLELLVSLLEDKNRMQESDAAADKMSMQRTLSKFEEFVEKTNKRRRKEMEEAELDCAAFKATASQLLAFVSERA